MDQRPSPIRATETRRHGVFKPNESLCLCVSVVCVGWLSVPHAQVLLDRVVARVSGVAITETDVRAAAGLGIIESAPGEDALAAGTRQMIDRQLILLEVNRFPPADPGDTAINDLAAAMKARAGPRYASLTQSTGLDDERVRQLARETLRIQGYVNQRFGTTAQASLQDARQYYETHPAEFTRDGRLVPFEQVEAAARGAASNERRRAAIAQWITDLRGRGDVVEVTSSVR